MKKAPAIFIGHGSPMNVIENNEFNDTIKKIGQKILENKPRAIVCISAHYQSEGIEIDGSLNPKTIYDFTGFPEVLYQMQYKAPGNPTLAKILSEILDAKVTTNWGLDHGAWNVLWHLIPNADIPVVMLSLDYNLSFEQHFNLGVKLNKLREKGVMILGSGNIVHSFKGIQFNESALPHQYSVDFEKYVKENISNKKFDNLIKFENSIYEAAKFSVNSAEHYLPLLYVLGASDREEKESLFNQKIVFSTLSMISVGFGI
jgi:4,5-DOPA dioxygenase extradiol